MNGRADQWRGCLKKRKGIYRAGQCSEDLRLQPLSREPLRTEASAAHRFAVGQFEITIVSDGTLTFPLSFAVPGHDPSEVKTLLKWVDCQVMRLSRR